MEKKFIKLNDIKAPKIVHKLNSSFNLQTAN